MAVVDHFGVVQELYLAFYQRPADPVGLRFWASHLEESRGDAAAITHAFAMSEEAAELYGEIDSGSIGAVITNIYQALFGRIPDADGKAFYEHAFASGHLTASNIALAILQAAHGEDQAVVANKLAAADIYTQLVDGRNFEDRDFGTGAGFQYTYGGNEDAAAARAFLAAITADSGTIPTVDDVRQALDSRGEPVEPEPTPSEPGGSDAPDHPSLKLTPGVDQILGTEGNDVITADHTFIRPVLGSGDVVDGAGGTDTFNITDTATPPHDVFRFPEGFVIRNIENLNVTTSGAFGSTAEAVDLSTIVGLASVSIDAGSDGLAGMSLRVSDTTDVRFASASTQETAVAGGKVVNVTAAGTVSVSGAGLQAVTLKGSTGGVIDNTGPATEGGLTGRGTTLSQVTLDAVTGTTRIKGDGVTEVTFKGNATAPGIVEILNATAGHALTLNMDGIGNASDVVNGATVSDATATSITVNATGARAALTLGDGSVNATLAQVTIVGDAALLLSQNGSFTALQEIDGSAATGDLTLASTGSVTTISTGSGNDTFTANGNDTVASMLSTGAGHDSITLSGTFAAGTEIDTGEGNDSVTLSGTVVAGSSVNLGGGDDKLLFNSGSFTTGVTIDGGDGVDALSAGLVSPENASQFHNFEVLSLSSTASLDVSLLDNSTIVALSMDGRASGTYTGLSKDQALTVNQDNPELGTTVLVFDDAAGASDTYTLTFNAIGNDAQNGKSTVRAGGLHLDGIEEIHIHSASASGAVQNAITLYGNAATHLLLTGDQALDVSFGWGFGGIDGVTTIDAIEASGDLRIDLTGINVGAAGIAVSAGTGNDVIVAQASGLQTFTGGDGSDVFDVSAARSALPIVTINDLESGDVIRLAGIQADGALEGPVDVSAASSLAEALEIANGEPEVGTGQLVWFQYLDHTYVYSDNPLDGLVGTVDSVDNIVQIVGAFNLEGSLHTADGSLTIGSMLV